MVNLEIVSSSAVPDAILAAYLAYASVPDSSQTALHGYLLKSAVLKVQEYMDRDLLTCTVKQYSPVPESGQIRLFLGGGTVSSVKDGETGADVEYSTISGGCVKVAGRGRNVVVTFTTSPAGSDWDKAAATVFRYATALFDGEDAGVLGSILNEVLQC